MTRVVIKDSLMGTGKSTRMIEEINNSPQDQKWIIVTPFLKECHRYAGTSIDPSSGDEQKPLRNDRGDIIYTGHGCSESGRRLQHPVSGYKTKVEDIERLAERGMDIVTTHSALKLFTSSTIKSIKDNGYHLVIDEELECIRPQNLQAPRRKMLLDSGAIYVDDQGLLRWNDDFSFSAEDEVNKDTGYSWDMQLKRLCDTGSLFLVEDTRSFFMWEYPVDFLNAFDNITILTYLFEGSVFEQYLKHYNIEYTIKKVVEKDDSIKDLILIVDSPSMNNVGNRDAIFSATDQRRYTKDSAVTKTMNNNLTHFFNNGTYGKSYSEDRLWTCLKDATNVFKGRGYSKRWLAANTKAVNDYASVSHLAYVYNNFLHPDIVRVLSDRGLDTNYDRYALSEMLQWVYRSRIRNGEEISLYIPSKRMRDLFTDWLGVGNI